VTWLFAFRCPRGSRFNALPDRDRFARQKAFPVFNAFPDADPHMAVGFLVQAPNPHPQILPVFYVCSFPLNPKPSSLQIAGRHDSRPLPLAGIASCGNGITQAPQENHPVSPLYTSLCTGELNAIQKSKNAFSADPFYGMACPWAMLREIQT